MVMARIGSSGRVSVMSPPNRPTMTYFPPLASASMPSLAVLAAPTKSMAAPIGAGAAACACFTASGAAASIAARAPALSAASRFLGSMSATPAPNPPIALSRARRLRPERRHLADDLVAHGERRDEPAILDRELLAAAEIVPAFPDVQVAVADAGGKRAQQHLGPVRLGGGFLGLAQRRAEIDDVVAPHGDPPLALCRA